MGGFIGATEEGVTSTLGRGGSDFTAAIVGAGIGAEEIQIWTDVDGMLTADPTVMPGGYRVKTISFAEAAELAYFGAKVLHPATVVPAIEKNIPVLILNSRRPEVEGTRIVRETVHCANVAKSIACKKKITLVNIVSTRMLMAHGFLRRIFEVFDRYETPVDMVATTRSQRLADHRQHCRGWRTSRASCGSSPMCPSKKIRRSSAWSATTSAHARCREPRVRGAERHQHPHDLAGSVAAEPECRGRAGRPEDGGGAAARRVLPRSRCGGVRGMKIAPRRLRQDGPADRAACARVRLRGRTEAR